MLWYIFIMSSPKERDIVMINKLKRLIHQQYIPASISVHYSLRSLSPNRCSTIRHFSGISIRKDSSDNKHSKW